MATKVKSAPPKASGSGGLNRMAGKKVFFSGNFDRVQYGLVDDLTGMIRAQQGKVVKKLDASVDYLVLSDLSGGKTVQKQAAALNAKGATIQILEADAFMQMLALSAEEVLQLIRAGDADTFGKFFGSSFIHTYHYQKSPPPRFTFTGENFDGLDLTK